MPKHCCAAKADAKALWCWGCDPGPKALLIVALPKQIL
jgi:hypothetical protein